MTVGVRLVIALAFILPYFFLPVARPTWLTFVVAGAGFGLGHAVEAWVKPARVRALIAALAVAAGGTVYLLGSRAARRTIDAYAEANAVAAAPSEWTGRRFRMHGHVAVGSFVAGASGGRRFSVEAAGAAVPVEYEGILPDGFRDKTEVVVTGRLEGGVFRAETVLARCPSSYPVKKP